MKRIYFLDIFRGISIIIVILIHCLINEYVNTEALRLGEEEISVIVLILFFIGTGGGVFFAITGIVSAFSGYKKLLNNNSLKEVVTGGIVRGIILIIANYIFKVTIASRSGILYILVRDGRFIIPSLQLMTDTGTLLIIGWTSIVISVILGLLFKNDGYLKLRRNVIFLLLIGLFMLFLTPFIRISLIDIGMRALEQNNAWLALIVGPFLYDNFPIFPFLVYGIFGAILGLYLAEIQNPGKEKNRAKKPYIILSVILMISGIIGTIFMGGMNPTTISDYTPEALLSESFRQYSQLGLIFLIFLLGIDFFDFSAPEKKAKRQKATSLLQLFGKISLTIFILESMMTAVVHRILNLLSYLFPEVAVWEENLGSVALVAIIEIAIWSWIIIVWAKYDNKGSLEQAMKKFTHFLTKKRAKKEILQIPNQSERS